MAANDTPHATNEDALEAIKAYCIKRAYKCRGCRYSIKYIVPDYKGYSCCIFANCPCTWEINKEEE